MLQIIDTVSQKAVARSMARPLAERNVTSAQHQSAGCIALL
jgi:hypothetical protein